MGKKLSAISYRLSAFKEGMRISWIFNKPDSFHKADG
jgi:hypothetical protein